LEGVGVEEARDPVHQSGVQLALRLRTRGRRQGALDGLLAVTGVEPRRGVGGPLHGDARGEVKARRGREPIQCLEGVQLQAGQVVMRRTAPSEDALHQVISRSAVNTLFKSKFRKVYTVF